MSATNPDPDIHIDWGGEHVTMRIATGNIEINLSFPPARGRSMIRQLQWAISEVERCKNHQGPSYLFVQNPHPGDGDMTPLGDDKTEG